MRHHAQPPVIFEGLDLGSGSVGEDLVHMADNGLHIRTTVRWHELTNGIEILPEVYDRLYDCR